MFSSNQSDMFQSLSDEKFLGEFFTNLQGKKNTRVFCKRIKGDDISTIPSVIFDLMDHILKVEPSEGIFRKPGSQTEIKKLVKKIEKKRFKFKKKHFKDVYDTGSLIKLFFREMRNPLIPQDEIPESIAKELLKNKKLGEKESFQKHIEEKFSKAQIYLLKKLCIFLVEFAKKEKETKMNLENLIICFNPNIVRPRAQTLMIGLGISNDEREKVIQNLTLAPLIFKELILNHEFYLKVDEN